MVSAVKDLLTFDELMATPIDFSKYAINRLKIDNLTQAYLVGPVYQLLKGTCTSNIELEYNMEECFKALTNKLDWNNPEGDRCPFDLTKPLPLKDPEKKYTTSITKTKAAQYEIKILSVVSVSVKKLHGYGHLEEIVVRRADRQLYKFKECDFVDLHLNDIEDMLLLYVQHKLFHLDGSDIVDFIVALNLFKRSLIIKRRVKDLQLGVEIKELYTPSFNPPEAVYEDLNKQKRVMRADDLYKFFDRTLKTVRDELHHRRLNFLLGYNKEMNRRKWSAIVSHPVNGGNTGCDDTIHRTRYQIIHFINYIHKTEFYRTLQVKSLT
ncbi:hypothetical protein Tco_0596441 [Tanacetum coccineum]